MMFQLRVILCLLIFGYSSVYSQSHLKENFAVDYGEIQGLQIGDNVPEVIMGKVISVDGSVTSARLSDFNDKLLILDLMYTRCTSCITGLVEKNRIQNQFGSKIKILVVVGGEGASPGILQIENESYIRKYLTSKNYLSFHGVKIPWVVENQVLNKFFPHRYVSHVVWIYKGKLIAITEQDYVSAENIQLVLDGKQNQWPIKNDFLPDFDAKIPLIQQYPGQLSQLIARNEKSIIFGPYQNGIFSKRGSAVDSISKLRRDYHTNRPILNLYAIYWSELTGQIKLMDPSRILLEVRNTVNYVVQEDCAVYDYVKRKNTYRSVEFNNVDTGQSKQQQAAYFIKELDNLLGVKGRYEKRKLKCLILHRIDNTEKFRAQSRIAHSFNQSNAVAPDINFNREYLRNIAYKMNKFYGNPPVFDETGYNGLISMKFKLTSWTDISAVRKALQSYGLDLREEEREIEVFVLTEQY